MIDITVRDLLNFIKKHSIPYDTKIFYQRIEDKYFDGIDISVMSGSEESGAINGIYPPGSKAKGWDTLKIKGEQYYEAVEFNKHIEEGKLVKEGKLDPDEVGIFFWDEKYKDDQKLIDLSDEDLLDQYVGVCGIYHNKENKALCITAHY